jgi:DNA-binding transcriptional LysR family regulator
VELRHLRYFRVVAQELHFGRAATRLHMEPQPLNFQIKQLERELGFALLTHRENRTYLTAAGAAFLADADEILTAADRAVEHGALIARGEAGVFRVGYVCPLVHAFLAPAIVQFRRGFPEVSFDLQAFRPAELERALNCRDIDLGIAPLPVPDDNFDAHPVARGRRIVAVPADDPLALRERIAWHELDGRDAISFEHRFPEYQRRIDALLDGHGVRLRAVQHVDEFGAALAFVGVGLGVAIVHLYADLAPPHGVAFLNLPDDAVAEDYAAIWRRDDGDLLRARFIETVAAAARAAGLPIEDRVMERYAV